MSDATGAAASMHERALRLALKEILAQQHYGGVVPAPPDYELVARRAMEIEQALVEASQRSNGVGWWAAER
jgi:hypothetical protein